MSCRLLGRYKMGIDPRSTLTVDPHQAPQRRAIAAPREEVDHVARSAQGLSRQPKYKIRDHLTPVAYTAQGIAALTHTPGKELAKTVIVKLDGSLAMAVVPASSQVDFSRLRTAASATHAVLASEQEFKDRFRDCETGAMPPFGNLYDLPAFADESLSRDKEIAFNAGSHRELVRMAWEDFSRLVKRRMAKFATEKIGSAAA